MMLGFLLVVILTTLPIGLVVLRQWSKNILLETAVVCVVVGIVVVTLESLLIGLLGKFNLLKMILLVQAGGLYIYILKTKYWQLNFLKLDKVWATISIVVVLLCVQFTQSFGYGKDEQLHMNGAHFIDSSWHVAIINSFDKKIPPNNPVYSDSALENYHYLTDLFLFIITQLTNRSPSYVYFNMAGVLLNLLLTSVVYFLCKNITKSRISSIFAVLFVSWSSNLFYIANFLYPSSQKAPSVMWVDYFSTLQVNYQVTFGLIIIFCILYLLIVNKENNKWLIIGILAGSLFGIKSQFSLVVVSGILIIGLKNLRTRRFELLKASIVSVLIGLSIVLIINPDKSSLILSPLWFIKAMYESPDRLNFSKWELARQYYQSIGNNLGLIKLFMQGILLFIAINIGPLAIGIFSKFKKEQEICNISKIWAGLGLTGSLVFIYKYSPDVTIQFIYLSIALMGLLTAIKLNEIRNTPFRIAICVGIWIILLPGVRFTVAQYQKEKTKESSYQLSLAIKLLNQLPSSTVVLSDDLRPGSHIQAFTNQKVFLGDAQIVHGLGIDSSQREKEIFAILNCSVNSNEIIDKYHVGYIVVSKKIPCLDKKYPTIPSNDITIYKV